MRYFFENYICINLKDYFGSDYDMMPMLWLFFLAVGISVACFVIHFYKNSLSLISKQLLRHRATAPESAKTLAEVGLGRHRFVRLLLRGDGHIYRIVDRVGAEHLSYEEYVAAQHDKRTRTKKERFSLDSARFFIKDASSLYAERLSEEGGASLLRPIAAACAILLVYLLLVLLAPSILSLLVA